MAGVATADSDALTASLAKALEPLLQPLRMGVQNLHLELLRQMYVYKREVTSRLDAFHKHTVSMAAEMEELRRENQRLKQMCGR
jgi:hypothetical protein